MSLNTIIPAIVLLIPVRKPIHVFHYSRDRWTRSFPRNAKLRISSSRVLSRSDSFFMRPGVTSLFQLWLTTSQLSWACPPRAHLRHATWCFTASITKYSDHQIGWHCTLWIGQKMSQYCIRCLLNAGCPRTGTHCFRCHIVRLAPDVICLDMH